MVYVQRNAEGEVSGLYYSAQPGFADEELSDDSPDVLKFHMTAKLVEFEAAIQGEIDRVARTRLFSDGVSLASYVTSSLPQWAAEAQAFVEWRDEVWTYAYAELAKVRTGERYQPTIEEFINELKPIVWPET